MKRNTLLLSSLLLVFLLSFSKVQAQNEINSVSKPENKIIVQVDIVKTELQGSWSHTISIIQFPKVLRDNMPLSLEVRYQNKSPEVFYLHIDHIGSTILTIPHIRGATTPIPIRPDGPGSSVLTIVEDQLPQEISRYSFGAGDHKIVFDLRSTEDITSPSHAQEQTDFTVFFLLEGKKHIYNTDKISVYPNPFIDEVVFDFNELNFPQKDTETSIILMLYDKNGVLKGKAEKTIQNNSKITYPTNTLIKGTYYFVITSNTGQKLDSGLLIKK